MLVTDTHTQKSAIFTSLREVWLKQKTGRTNSSIFKTQTRSHTYTKHTTGRQIHDGPRKATQRDPTFAF